MARMEIKDAMEILDDWCLHGDNRLLRVAWGRIRAKLAEPLPTSHNTQSDEIISQIRKFIDLLLGNQDYLSHMKNEKLLLDLLSIIEK